MFFAISDLPARPSAGIGGSLGTKTRGFFAISDLAARLSAEIGVVEVQEIDVLCDF